MIAVRPFFAVLLLVAGASVAFGQESRPERPFRGLFGGDDAGAQQGLVLSGTLGAGYDTDLEADARGATALPIDGATLSTGPLGQFSGSAAYSLSTDGSSFSASAGTTGRYYPTSDSREIVRRDYASVQGSTRLGMGFAVFGGANYSPFRLSDLYSMIDSSSAPGADFDQSSSAEHFVSVSGGGSWGHQLTRRTSVSMDYRYGTRTTSIDVPHQHSHQAGTSLRHNLARGLDVVFGYQYTEASYGSGQDYVSHGLNAGVDFRRALSFSRSTTLAFTTGTAAFDDPTTPEGVRYRAVGSATLNHEIGRTWAAAASYSRNIRFSETLMNPIFSDSLTLRLGGLINRRVTVHSAAGAVTGRVSEDSSGGGFDQYYGDAGLTFAMSRHVGFGTSYRFHRHRLGNTVSIAPGVPPRMDRHSVQAYMTVWMPVFQQRARTP